MTVTNEVHAPATSASKEWMTRWRWWLMGGAVLLAAGTLGLVLRGVRGESPAVHAAKPVMTVTMVRPQRDNLALEIDANGSVAAWQETVIGSEANGLRLAQVEVNVGDQVRAGQLLARFADDTVRAEVAQARANLMEAQAAATEAEANGRRVRELGGSGALSPQQISQYLGAEQTAAARVAAARAGLQTHELRLHQTRVLAPDSGMISARSATVGAVTLSGAELFRMIRQGRLEWRGQVNQDELARIKPGMAVKVRGINGEIVTGTVRTGAPTLDPQTRTALVYVDLPATATTAAALKAGMFAAGRFDLGNTIAVTLPQQAIVLRDGFSYVFHVGADLRVNQYKVTTGRRLGPRIEILSGLPDNAAIAAQGAAFLQQGDLVRIAPTATSATLPAKAVQRLLLADAQGLRSHR